MPLPWFAVGKPVCHRGEVAPDFALPDATGQVHQLSAYRGRWVLLYFYPRDNTPLCTRQACGLRDHAAILAERQVVVLGVSLDSSASHAAFAASHQLTFPLLSDDGTVAHAYGALLRLGPLKLARRYSFLLDPQGRVRQCYFNVDVARHTQQVLQDIR